MKRREFLKFSATGLTVVAVGTMAEWPMFWRGSQAHAASFDLDRLRLDMVAVQAEMVDGIHVPMWAFKVVGDDFEAPGQDAHLTVPRIPGPTMVAMTGDRIRLRITNNIGGTRVHRFAIPGVTLTVDGENMNSVVVPHDDRVDIEFRAPAPGTYMYFDPENAPVNRMMGLHGALVVLPNPVGNNTPYLNPTTSIQRLFDDLGEAPHFSGAPWDLARNTIWVFNAIDSARCTEAADISTAIGSDRFARSTGFLPEYFTLNGKSGFFSAQHHHDDGMGMEAHGSDEGRITINDAVYDLQSNISFRGTIGQPMLIRTLNAGNMWHSPHIHGNHIYPLSHNNIKRSSDPFPKLETNLTLLDTWALAPGDIKDLLHPFVVPPDIPVDKDVVNAQGMPTSRKAWPPQEERFPLVYPMHDHNEISNTAAGGNYPHGMATHWQIDGVFDPSTIPPFVTRAELRVKTGQLIVEGRFKSGKGGSIELVLHAGGADGPIISRNVKVGSDGRFSFRGRALKAIPYRLVTLMRHFPDREGVASIWPLRVR